jgi:hypothetical protein
MFFFGFSLRELLAPETVHQVFWHPGSQTHVQSAWDTTGGCGHGIAIICIKEVERTGPATSGEFG